MGIDYFKNKTNRFNILLIILYTTYVALRLEHDDEVPPVISKENIKNISASTKGAKLDPINHSPWSY